MNGHCCPAKTCRRKKKVKINHLEMIYLLNKARTCVRVSRVSDAKTVVRGGAVMRKNTPGPAKHRFTDIELRVIEVN